MDNRRKISDNYVLPSPRASALYNYVGNAPDELSFEVGDDLEIRGTVPEDGWFTAYNRRTRQSGFVPSNYVTYNTTHVTSDTTEAGEISDTTEAGEISDTMEAGEIYGTAIATNVSQETFPSSHEDNTETHVELRSTSPALGTITEDHKSGGENELRASRADIVEVLHPPADGWVWVRHLSTKQDGYIPIEKLLRKDPTKKKTIAESLKDVLNAHNACSMLSTKPISPGACSTNDHRREDSFSDDDQEILVKAIYDFTARSDGELTVSTSEELIILEKEENWSFVKSKHSQQCGYVPTNYLQMALGDAVGYTTDDSPIQNGNTISSDVGMQAVATMKCDKGAINSSTHVKNGEEVEVLEESNNDYILVRKKNSQQTFYAKREELDFTSSSQKKVLPKKKEELAFTSSSQNRVLPTLPLNTTSPRKEELDFTSSSQNRVLPTLPSNTTSSKQSQKVTNSTSSTPPLPLSPKPKMTPSPAPQEISSNEAIQGTARLKCEMGFVKEGEEVEILDTSDPNYLWVRHKATENDFFVGRDKLDFTPANHRRVPPTPTSITRSSTNASELRHSRPVPTPTSVTRSSTSAAASRHSRPLPTPPNLQDSKPNVPLKPNRGKDQVQRMSASPPAPPVKRAEKPSIPQRNVNTEEPIYEDDIRDKDYYMGTIERSAIRPLLTGPGTQDGTFIVRKSGTVDDEYAISVRHEQSVKHYRIKLNKAGLFYVNEGQTFHDVMSLVEHYQKHGGLQHNLIAPYCKRVPSKPTTAVRKTPPPNSSGACPICFESLETLRSMSRQLYSTSCGHIFCNHCLTQSLRSKPECPTCRKKETIKNCHPIFL